MSGIIYLSSPYTHDDEEVEYARFDQALLASASLIRNRELMFSPIVHSHPIARAHHLPGLFPYWIDLNRAWIRVCGKIYLLQIQGWKESKGMRAEYEYALDLGKPIYRMVPVDDEYEIIPVKQGALWTT